MKGHLFFGEPIEFWLELRKRLDARGEESLEVLRLLKEVVVLRGRLDFYESRIKEMNSIAIQEIQS